MNKEVLIALIAKDIKELEKLTQGFSAMDSFPAPYMDLAIDKAKNLVENIVILSNIGNQPVITETKKEIEKVEHDEPDILPPHIEYQQDTDVNEETTETTETIGIETRTVEEDKKDISIKDEKPSDEIYEPYEEEIEPEQEPVSQSQEEEIGNNYPEEERTTILGDSIKSGESILNTLSKNQDTSIASTVAMKKIDDLKSALTIADRFRFQRELFGGDGERMMQAINDFNKMKSMDEALAFINKKFAWKKDSPCVKSFLQLIQRRYL
jgi:hypothetical protein